MTARSSVPGDLRFQLRLACLELERRLRLGDDCSCEKLLKSYPLIAANGECAAELIVYELTVRRELGQVISPEDCLRRFPQWREPLRLKLESHWPPPQASPNLATVDELTVSTGVATNPTLRVPVPSLGHHQLLEVIGQGGMGVVCKARHTLLDKTFALKMIANGVLASAVEVQRFLREARAAAELDHPNIVRIFEIGCENNQHFFTMTFMPGGSLLDHKMQFAEPRTAALLVEKLARAVHYAHEKGIVHRDLKPANVLLDETGEPRISDFGLAKLLDREDDQTLSVAGQLLGTLAYMPPEQARGEKDRIGRPCDVWALGVILYELVARRRPFLAPSRDALLGQITSEEPPFPCAVQPGCPRQLEAIILKCLEKDPGRRYPTALELAQELRRFLNDEPVQTRTRWSRRLLPRSMWIRRSLAALLLAGLLGTGLLAVLPPRLAVPAQVEAKTDLLTRLRARERVILIPEVGLPRWSEQTLGTGSLTLPEGKADQPPLLLTWSYSCIELVPDPCSDSYSIRASVRQDNSQRGETGIYLLGTANETTDGKKCQYLYTVNFADQGQLAGKIQFYARRIGANTLGDTSRIAEASLPSLRNAWRDLEVRVSPERIDVFLNGALLWSLNPDTLTKRVVTMHPGQKPQTPQPQLKLRSPIGLYGLETGASFRNVILQPL